MKWTNTVRNEKVLEMVDERRFGACYRKEDISVLDIGHFYRHNIFVDNIIEGKREIRQGRSRPWMSCIKKIMEYPDLDTNSALKRMADDKES